MSRQRGSKPASFVKLLVIGQKGLRHDSKNPTAVQNGGRIEELPLDNHRKTNHGNPGELIARRVPYLSEGGQGRMLKGLLLKEITTGVAGQA